MRCTNPLIMPERPYRAFYLKEFNNEVYCCKMVAVTIALGASSAPAQPLTCMEKLAPSLPICPPALVPGTGYDVQFSVGP